MKYIVRNILYGGVYSVGTNPLASDAAANSAAIRTGADERDILDSIRQLHPTLVRMVDIPAVDDQHCAARIEVAR